MTVFNSLHATKPPIPQWQL